MALEPTPLRVVCRLLSNVHTEGTCIVSDYSTGSHGYSQIGWHPTSGPRSAMRLGHRVAWEAAYGPIPDGLAIDHICRNQRCINIEHLRLLTNVENARDNGFAGLTHCKRGHPYDDENTYRNKVGHRQCRECSRINRRKRSAA